ncbi:succinate:quinone oxidoreductase subunit C [Aspergillus mulundensis]|uniref:Succinate dehydrogenase, cytochrome b556 subunit n=1 Tax=Aspergillus mulundensis TaxID=1810919 RepID=A0A3D8RYZ4_9EURO|nr:Succinate dehydrogenase, cytochrome b556 subunit [Aspergillus mulundensis]RDW79269.1 Succinate dehydrogenase, cytochrome b556 subunit [Aspergillus mulundensis]
MFAIRPQLRTPRGCVRAAATGGISQRCSRVRVLLPTSVRSSSSKTKVDPRSLLAKQRLNRPVSPHLSIYRPQITWIVSIATRITGIALSGGLYLYSTAYLSSPVTGWDIGSASVTSAFSSLSPTSKFAIKFAVAYPFTFHAFNGVRHLVWDTGRGLTNRQVARSGWAVVGASGVVATLLAAWRPGDE